MQEMLVIESETNSLRLTASDQTARLLDEIKEIYSELFKTSSKMMSDFVEVIINNNQALLTQHQDSLQQLGEHAKEKSAQLREQMRNDLKQI